MRFSRLLSVAMGLRMPMCKPALSHTDSAGTKKALHFLSSFFNKVNDKTATLLTRPTKPPKYYYYMTKIFLPLAGFLLCCCQSFAQLNPTGFQLNESQLSLNPGTTTVPDATALGGTTIMRPSGAARSTMWYGPYGSFQAGNYLIQVRLKVSSRASAENLVTLDVWSNTTQRLYARLSIKPSDFRFDNDWQLFTIPAEILANVPDLEIRGMDFVPGIADLYLDYINIIPGDLRGYYSEEFTITGTGSVGIGSYKYNDANYKLFVEKGIRTRKVKVDLENWPDYVFDSAYKLPPLNTVEQFVRQHKHLPQVPSSEEVKKEGLDLGDQQATLLKKIEELTLYLIEQAKTQLRQEKIIEGQQTLLIQQSKEIDGLREEIKTIKRIHK